MKYKVGLAVVVVVVVVVVGGGNAGFSVKKVCKKYRGLQRQILNYFKSENHSPSHPSIRLQK